jgi:hypothetical protein
MSYLRFFYCHAEQTKFLGEPLRSATPRLASGYPLHHLRPPRFAVRASVVPLLSLSQRLV